MNEIQVESNIEHNIYYPCLQEEFAHAILNILVNAKDIFIAREIDDAKLFVTLEKKEDTLQIIINDNAGGIRLSTGRSIFEPDVSTKQNGGLGLYITKKIIEDKMKGSIEVNNIDSGASFKILFPSDPNQTLSDL